MKHTLHLWQTACLTGVLLCCGFACGTRDSSVSGKDLGSPPVGDLQVLQDGRVPADLDHFSTEDLPGRNDWTEPEADGSDAAADVLADPALARWHAFGVAHAGFSMDDSPHACALDQCPCGDAWVTSYEVTLERSNGASELILQGTVADSKAVPIPGPLTRTTHVAVVPSQAAEEASICLSMYREDHSVYLSGCRPVVIRAGRYGQLVWQFSFGSCEVGPECQNGLSSLKPEESAGGEAGSPSLHFLFTMCGDLCEPPGNLVSVGMLPKVSCETALQWLGQRIPDYPAGLESSCFDDSDWTQLSVRFPTSESAFGFYHELMQAPEAVPMANLYSAHTQGYSDSKMMVGLAWGQMGLAQAQWPCETIYCSCGASLPAN